jgi:tetratricopeptide (TPR) repeat protein
MSFKPLFLLVDTYQTSAFDSLCRRPPQLPDEQILAALSLALWNLGRVSEASTAFRLLDQSGTLPFAAQLAWGWWLLHEGELDKVEVLFTQALESEPNNDQARLGMAYLRFYQKDFRAAASLFLDLSDRGQFSSPRVMARSALDLAEGRRPTKIEVAPIMGLPPGLAHVLNTRLIQGKNAAIEYVQSMLPLAPEENLLPIQRLVLEWELEEPGPDLAARMRPELEALLQEHPNEGKLWQFYGVVLRRLNLRRESLDAFHHATKCAPLEPGTWAGVGASLMETGELEKSIAYYETAVLLEPAQGQYLAELATCLAGLKKWESAIAKFTDAFKLGVATFDLHFNRGLCRLELGYLSLAMEDLRAALEIDPAHRRAAHARELLQFDHAGEEDRFRFGEL